MYCFYFDYGMYLSRTRDCRVYIYSLFYLSLSQSGLQLGGGILDGVCVIVVSSFFVGVLSRTCHGAQRGFSTPRHLHMTSRVPLWNLGRHTNLLFANLPCYGSNSMNPLSVILCYYVNIIPML